MGSSISGRRRVPTVTVCALLGLAGCATDTSVGDAAPVGFAPSAAVHAEIRVDVVDWSDDWHHVVVAVDRAAPTTVDDLGVPVDVPGGLSWWTVSAGGDRSLGAPPKSLRPVHADGRWERVVLAIAPSGSMVAVDDDGVVAAPGTRYLRTLTETYAMDVLIDTVVRLSGSEFEEQDPEPAQATVDAADELADAVWRIDGVVEVSRVSPQLLAVAMDDRDAEDRISELDGVAEVATDGLLGFSDDARQAEQWMIVNTGSASQANGQPGVAGADTDVDAAWEVTTGAGIVVAVIDSGVDIDHPDLAGRIWSNPDEVCGNGVDDDANGFVDDCNGWDFGQSDATPFPDSQFGLSWHGTHVAGLIAAARDGGGVVGMAPDATIMPLKVSNPSGMLTTSWIAGAIDYAVAHGADVVNLSLGSQPGSPRSHHAVVERAIANAGAHGVVVVAAMGNDGIDTSTLPTWPAGFAVDHDNVIAVAASTNSDTAASFSNRGTGVTIWAPGYFTLSSVPNGSHAFASGTSMATPVVAGAAALVRASGVATAPGAISDRLVATAALSGAGPRLDAAAAVGASTSDVIGTRLTVAVAGADQVVAERDSTLAWTVSADDPSGIVGLELLAAAQADGVVGAVEGLEATLTDATGSSRQVISDDAGSFGVVGVAETSPLSSGVTFTLALAAPAADYGFVVRAVDAAGEAASDGYVTFVSMPAPPETAVPHDDAPNQPPDQPFEQPSTGEPPTQVDPSPGVPTQPDGGGDVPPAPDEPPTATPSAPVTPVVPPDTTAPSAPGGTSAPPPVASVPAAPTPPDAVPSPAPPTATPGSSPSQTESPAAPSAPPVTAPPSEPTAPVDNAPPSEPTAPPTPAVPMPSSPSTPSTPSTPANTPPATGPVASGDFSIASMTPRSSTVAGGVTSVMTGRFPTDTNIWVWFGEGASSVVRGRVVSAEEIWVTSPPANEPGVRDVHVRFSTTTEHDLVLANGYTYVSADDPSPHSPPASGSSPTTPNGPPSSDPGVIITIPAPPLSDPAPTPDPGTSPPPVPTPPPSSEDAGDGSGGGGSTAAPAGPRVRHRMGEVTLREMPTSSPLHRLGSVVWPTGGCRAASCGAVRLGAS